jgi:tetratricopeptide (TPR) repeat protein
MRRLLLILFVFFCLQPAYFSQVKKYLRKAARATENGQLEKARLLYLKGLAKDSMNYKLNLGIGLNLSEFMDRPEEALKYLERAYNSSPKDTLPDLLFALAKVYEHYGRYKDAIPLFDRLAGVSAVEEDDSLFQMDVRKRKADCYYGIEHDFFTSPKDWYVVNVGSNINTQAPEYVPVLTPNNELLFTSKRQDDPKEKINDIDGKFFESMYISELKNGRFNPPRRYTIPDLFAKSKFRKHHESIISMSPDGKKLFLYRDTKIFEVTMDAVKKESPKKLSKSINFAYYQNHAYLTRDGNTLYFTSESSEGEGGNDIYVAKKGADGNWTKPENLGAPVNTAYDEDAPFVSDDGKTLYFASKGHPSYGSFDIYKSTWEDGKWSSPENLGKPINSAAHDIFMITNGEGNIGYFSSSRVGGKGDMDIYKINYLKDYDRECTTHNDATISLSTEKLADTTTNKYLIKAGLPDYYKILRFAWSVNGTTVNATGDRLEYGFKEVGTYPVEVKIVSYCDTCMEPFVACNTTSITVEQPIVIKPSIPDLSSYHGQLSKDQLLALGFDVTPIRFNFNKADVREDMRSILDKNLEVLKTYPDLYIEITGHADSQGKPSRNMVLSGQRAQNVKAYLTKKGLAKKRIKRTYAKGAKELLNDCIRGEDCPKEKNEVNRRVEISVFRK